MPPPLYRTGKLNGRVMDFVSDDGGKSWRPTPDSIADTEADAMDPDLTDPAQGGTPENLGTTDGKLPLVSRVLGAKVDTGEPQPQPPAADSPLAKVKAGMESDGGAALKAAKGGDAIPTQVTPQPVPMSGPAAFLTAFPHALTYGFNDDAAASGSSGFDRYQALKAQQSPLPSVAGFAGLPTGELPLLNRRDMQDLEMQGAFSGPTHLTRGIDGTPTGQTSENAAREIVNAPLRQAEHDHPGWSLGGMFAGGALGSLPLTALMGMFPGLGALGNVTRGVIQGGVSGGISGAGEADPGQRMEGMKRGAEGGAIVGGAIPLAFSLPGISHVMDKITNALEGEASQQRGLSSGPSSGQIEAMKEMKGPGAVKELGRDMERTGMTEPGFLPKSYQGTEEAAHASLGPIGQKVEAVAKMADQKGLTVDMRPVAMAMEDEATRLSKLGLPEADRAAAALRDKVNTIIGYTKTVGEKQQWVPGNPDRPYTDAWEYRKFIDDMAFDAEGQKSGIEAGRLRKIAGEVRAAMRAALGGDPKLAEAMESANKEYETASRVYNNAKRGASVELGSDNPQSPLISKGSKRAVAARTLREAENVTRAIPNYAPAATGAMMPNIPWLFDTNQSQEQR